MAYKYFVNKPNQLSAVTDSAANALGFYYKSGNTGFYTYDTEGNLLTDPYKGLSTKYTNVLNKCDSITLTGTGLVTYTYDAGGNILRKNTYNNGGTLTSSLDYIGGMVFSSGVISYMAMPEGRVLYNGTALVAEYIISDQQGNARMSFQDNGSGAVQVNQENSYYAFGEVLAGSPVVPPAIPNTNLYNGGAEWQNEFGNLPDYHQTFFRNYDPEIGRFTGADPKPESADGMTVYQYAGDDPVNKNDPMGDVLSVPSNWRSGGQPPQIVFSPTSDAFDGEDPSYDMYSIGGSYDMSNSGGGGMYAYDPGLAGYMAITTGSSVYHAGNRAEGDPSTGSLAQGIAMINATATAALGHPLVNANTFWVYLDGNGHIISQAAGEGIGGIHYYGAGTSTLDGQTVVTSYGEVGANQGGGLGEASPNSAYTMRDNFVTYKDLFNEFKTGTGPEYSGFGPNSPMTQDMEDSYVVREATLHFLANGSKPMVRWDAGFGLVGAFNSGTDMTAQFIGGARISIFPTEAGFLYILDNTTDQNSYHLHMGDSTPRTPGTITPEGTIYQRFMWVVPYTK